jgi:hypothetical protein
MKLSHPLFAFVYISFAVSGIGITSANDVTPAKQNSDRQTVARILKDTLDHYNKLFPDIHFIHLAGGKHTSEELSALFTLVDSSTTIMDYQHPPELSEDLLIVSLERLKSMMLNRIGSATLFRFTETGGMPRRHLCAITIDGAGLAPNNLSATRQLVNLRENRLQRIRPGRYIDRFEYLAYSLHHEAYHCLDIHFYGGMPMSKKEYWASYQSYYNEKGADLFSLAHHIKKHGSYTTFCDNLLRLRKLALYNNDPEHFAREKLCDTLKNNIANFRRYNTRQIFEFAYRAEQEMTPSYTDYVRYLAAAARASRKLGANMGPSTEAARNLESMQVEPSTVAELVNISRNTRNELLSSD